MIQPTLRQIETAKSYLRKRVEAELSMERDLHALIGEALRRLMRLQKRFGMSLGKLIASRRPVIRQKIDEVVRWLIAQIEEDVELLATNGLEDDREEILAYIKRKQYGKTFGDRLDGYVHRLVSGEKSGKNIPKAMGLLVTYAVAEGWMYRLRIKAEREGASGFFSMRGSSYPCSHCDSMVGFHPIGEYVGLWHPRCKCLFVFV